MSDSVKNSKIISAMLMQSERAEAAGLSTIMSSGLGNVDVLSPVVFASAECAPVAGSVNRAERLSVRNRNAAGCDLNQAFRSQSIAPLNGKLREVWEGAVAAEVCVTVGLHAGLQSIVSQERPCES